MQGWWVFLLIGFLAGFVAGGEWRHRLWKNQDRAFAEEQIEIQRQHIELLQKQQSTGCD